MPALHRGATALRCVRNGVPRTASASTTSMASAAAARSFSLSSRRRGGAAGKDDHHGSAFEPPTGWLFGVPPGEKAPKEGWEVPMYVYMASFVVTGIFLAFKPDTS